MSGDLPGISVALATRNGARFLERQLASILAQTVPVDEVVVSDDVSTDDTLAIVDDVARSAPGAIAFVVLAHDEPLGVTGNFERAIAACRGDVIVLSDQDDVWSPSRIERALGILGSDRSPLLVHSDARLIDGDGTPLGTTLFESLEVSAADLAAIHAGRGFEVLLRRNLATGATIAFRRSLLDLARPFPASWVHDEWLAIVAAGTGGLEVIEDQLIDYRQHGSNEIGVRAPTLRYRVARALEPGAGRNAGIAARFDLLRTRLGSRLAPADLAELDAKIAHERARGALPRARIRRVPSILREWRSGAYRRYSSRGAWDVVRDLLQPR